MATATAMASETSARRGFANRCIYCGAEDGMKLHLGDVRTLECDKCSEELTTDDIRGFLDSWTRLLAWLGSVPVRD